MKRIIFVFVTLITIFLASCSNNNVNKSTNETVTITFIQHTYINNHYNENKEINGYYFENDEIARTTIEFKKGHYLTQKEINYYRSPKELNYKVPPLNGWGYYSLTFFTTEYNPITKESYVYLKPMHLEEDITVHFGIFG